MISKLSQQKLSQRFSFRFLAVLLTIMLGAVCAGALCSCGNAQSSGTTQTQHEGKTFTLGNLKIVYYDNEMAVNTAGDDCLAIYLSVTNNGTSEESVMGSYNVSRSQNGTHLKVAVALDTNGNSLHTGDTRISPGETKDITLCFVLQNESPVTITFGNEERGVAETTLVIPLPVEE